MAFIAFPLAGAAAGGIAANAGWLGAMTVLQGAAFGYTAFSASHGVLNPPDLPDARPAPGHASEDSA